MTRRVLVLLLLVLAATAARADAATPTPTQVRLWFTAGEQFAVVDRTIGTLNTKALPTVNALLRGPTAEERARNIATQIPDGVRVISLTLTGRAAVLDLSPEFVRGIPARAADRSAAQELSLNARLGQVVYTLTQFSQITSAKVRSDGRLLSLRRPKDDAPSGGTLGRRDFAKPQTGPKRTQTAPTGPAVASTRQLQQRLADLGYLPASAVDGRKGYRTSQAVMAFQAYNGLQRDGVAGPQTTAKLASATRPAPRTTGPARRIEVDRARGIALLIEGGRVTRAIHVSAGAAATPTPAGRYRVFRKELRSWSVPFSVYLPYASYFNNGIAFHEYADVPAYPASHGCVRVPAPEAAGVYAFASNGTAVVVV